MNKTNLNNIDYYFIENNKFKTNTINICFKEKVAKENIIRRQSLPKILVDRCNKYDTNLKMRRHLNYLYSTSVSIKCTSNGQYNLLIFSLTYIQSKYLDKDITKDVIEFIKEVIYNPYQNDGIFDEDLLKRIKNELNNQLKQKAQSFSIKAAEGAFDETFGNQPITAARITKEKIESLNSKEVYDYYQQVLKTNKMLITFEGDKDIKEHLEIFNSENEEENEFTYPNDIAKEVGLKIVKDKTKQNNIYLIYDNFSKDPNDIFKNSVFSMMLGSGANSLLFKEVREKHSLAYSIGSSYDSINSIMSIMGGVKLEALDQTIDLINQCIDSFKKDDLTEHFNDVIQSYVSDLDSFFDHKNGPTVRLIRQWSLNRFRTIEESIKEVKKVTIEDIKEIAGKIKLKITYVIQGEIKDEN